jgi:hypothetical protein
MGLDMYLEGRKHRWNSQSELVDGFPVKSLVLEMGYWRKHPNLHGFIVREFAGGEDHCQPIDLSQDDIVKIIAAVKERRLPHTSGFFFGASREDDDEVEYDLSIFTRALLWLQNEEKDGYNSVVYQASW